MPQPQESKEQGLISKVQATIEGIASALADSKDIVNVIKEDHKPLKELLKVMKDSSQHKDKIVDAFTQFAPLLLTHAKAEEESLYKFLRSHDKFRADALEGDIEHGLADQMVELAKRASDGDTMLAEIKVLAELVEHHIKEEESDLLPKVGDALSLDQRHKLTEQYVEIQAQVIAAGQDDAPPESEISENQH